MAKYREKLPDPALPAPDPEDLPEVLSLGLQKVKGGWCVLLMRSQGWKVLDAEVLSGPEDYAAAATRFRISAIKELFPRTEAMRHQ